ncbi:hypothetical protein G6L16_000700 [Agrobacterium tumefaciens]|uniref:hypothetical protein n=1 Tax=Agrobacterium tumefaciens TaxID=358 RepID=UPI0015731A5E|nr:hypothetical protein [Agrobacterium tumefaciens]NSZ61850.1 hypothetical protein [Agrobacterium tumefaciens]NTA68222.1 hypothetical protein [Agrobacterium tumefaciens]WIE38061.1 hypothetical protein G6L16_000700 [Agrobacterium tumefaciens]
MSDDDDKKRFNCYDAVHYKPVVSTYIQFKRIRATVPSRDWNVEWQNFFRENAKALDADFHKIRNLVVLKDNALSGDADADPEMLKAAEELIDYWRREPEETPLPTPAIERPPGHHLIVLLQRLLPKSVFERLYGQMIADARLEYCEALIDGDFEEAKKIKRHLNYSLIASVASFIMGLPYHLLVKSSSLFDKGE